MRYGTAEGVGKPVSRVVLGTMIVTTNERERSFRLLDDALAVGCTTLDTAHVYAGGTSERCIGDWMRERGNRGEVVVVSKGAHPNADRRRVTPYDIAADLHDSLARLKTDYIDLYLLHRDDPAVPVGEIVDALDEHRRAGRIRAYGGSNWTHERLQAANDYAATHGRAPFVASSPNYSLAEQINDPWGQGSGSVTLSGPANAAARAWYARTRMPVFAWSSLARGFFSGRITRGNFESVKGSIDGACLRAYCHEPNFRRLDRVEMLAREKGLSVPQVAMAYVMSQPLDVFALVGAQDKGELQAAIDACDMHLAPAKLAWLDLESDEKP